MKVLIPTINEIVKYGLQSNLTVADKEKLLERDLVKFYSLYFDIEYKFDEVEFKDFDKSQLPEIRKNVESNFEDYGIYKTILDINDLDDLQENTISDAIEDLTDSAT